MAPFGGKDQQCGKKRGYLSRAIAKRHMKQTQRMPGRRWEKMNIYQCPYCGLWHVGHALRRKPGDENNCTPTHAD